jgi:hypothetical protein
VVSKKLTKILPSVLSLRESQPPARKHYFTVTLTLLARSSGKESWLSSKVFTFDFFKLHPSIQQEKPAFSLHPTRLNPAFRLYCTNFDSETDQGKGQERSQKPKEEEECSIHKT